MPENQPSIIAQIAAETWEHPAARVARLTAFVAVLGHTLRAGKVIDRVEDEWHDRKEQFHDWRDQRKMEAQYDNQ